jgi:uncharacterized protein
MKWKQIDQQPRSYVLIFNTGDELATGLKDFATKQNLADASFKAIGALGSVKLAWFNPETKKYHHRQDNGGKYPEQFGCLALYAEPVGE